MDHVIRMYINKIKWSVHFFLSINQKLDLHLLVLSFIDFYYPYHLFYFWHYYIQFVIFYTLIFSLHHHLRVFFTLIYTLYIFTPILALVCYSSGSDLGWRNRGRWGHIPKTICREACLSGGPQHHHLLPPVRGRGQPEAVQKGTFPPHCLTVPIEITKMALQAYTV